ncbi:MAG: hypothetical protein KA388_03985 [Rhodocyclaceae bacterium]|nr:hypothetical protein [Rhodocyclaceae bacterium]MBK9625343.1 hypothetical protein [Rhodocyclaceae bacterium]MBP6109630.1 hypothetical protein [Rhodocyclaceae bacterium]MBP6278898.1 hypothetical protein [Rhodocyclaceae bacterium]
MYIVAIAWAYVTILMAATEANLVAGLLTLFFYGILPLGLLLWIFGSPKRRHIQRMQEAQEAQSEPPTENSP